MSEINGDLTSYFCRAEVGTFFSGGWYNHFKICRKEQIQQAEPLLASQLPDLPFQKVGTDLFEWKGWVYLLLIDYYSRCIEIALLKHPSAQEVIEHTKSIFARHGIPEQTMDRNITLLYA